MQHFEEFATFSYAESLRRRWNPDDDGLVKEWYLQHPHLFDEDDFREAMNQSPQGKHFCEWLTAILLHQSLGYLSLIEKYQYRTNHARKNDVFRSIAPPGLINAIKSWKTDATQCPDLFVYHPESHDWFLCEIKGPGDTLRVTQQSFFGHLAEATGKAIRLVTLKRLEM